MRVLSIFWALLVPATLAAQPVPEASQAPAGPPAWGLSAAVINDNYTGTQQNGIDGKYWGADDFLTVSYLLRGNYGDWAAGFSQHTVTSRRFQFRYDLLSGRLAHSWSRGPYYWSTGAGLIFKGQFLGDALQNGFHRLKDLPELDLPYREGGLGAQMTAAGGWQRSNLLAQDHLSVEVEALGYSQFVASRLRLSGVYAITFGRLHIQTMLAWLSHGHAVEDYSEFIRSGPSVGGSARIALLSRLYLEIGALVFPVRNLENDPLYESKTRRYSPQIWMVLGWGKAPSSLRGYSDY